MSRSSLAMGLMFISPCLVGLLVFMLYPVAASFYFSFCDYMIFESPKFIGLDNYGELVHDPLFWTSLYNTLYYTADAEYQEADDPLAMEGPHRLLDSYAELTRTPDGWRISKRRSLLVFRRDPEEPVRLETWGKSEGRTSE